METKNPIEGVRLSGAVASLRSRDDSLGTCRRRASVYLERPFGHTRGKAGREGLQIERIDRWETSASGLTKMHLFSSVLRIPQPPFALGTGNR